MKRQALSLQLVLCIFAILVFEFRTDKCYLVVVVVAAVVVVVDSGSGRGDDDDGVDGKH